MSTPLANPRRTKLHTWPKRHEATPERDRSAAHTTSDTAKHQPEKRTNQQ